MVVNFHIEIVHVMLKQGHKQWYEIVYFEHFRKI